MNNKMCDCCSSWMCAHHRTLSLITVRLGNALVDAAKQGSNRSCIEADTRQRNCPRCNVKRATLRSDQWCNVCGYSPRYEMEIQALKAKVRLLENRGTKKADWKERLQKLSRIGQEAGSK